MRDRRDHEGYMKIQLNKSLEPSPKRYNNNYECLTFFATSVGAIVVEGSQESQIVKDSNIQTRVRVVFCFFVFFKTAHRAHSRMNRIDKMGHTCRTNTVYTVYTVRSFYIFRTHAHDNNKLLLTSKSHNFLIL